MTRVAVLDDYQRVARHCADWYIASPWTSSLRKRTCSASTYRIFYPEALEAILGYLAGTPTRLALP